MVLTGDGGDEVLSGYTVYQGEKFAHRYQQIPAVVRDLLPRVGAVMSGLTTGRARSRVHRALRVLSSSAGPFEERLRMKSSSYSARWTEELAQGFGPQRKLADFLSDFSRRYPAHDPFYRLMLFHLKVQLPDDYLVKVDRMSMAHSLETRVPFLDHRLVEFMATVSKDVKMRGYERKSVLRETVGRKLPAEVLRGPKKGFSVPVGEWFKDRAFHAKLETLAKDESGLNCRTVRDIVAENREGRADWGNLIWTVFMLRAWLQNPN
jgi:asparagine synthase (glutamine-hydrolysing)